MTLAFRNVDASPEDPVESWPMEAIQTALERGSLMHWRRLARAIEADPWGPVARSVEEVLTYSRPYGVADSMSRVIERSRVAAQETERRVVADEISDLIRRSGLTQSELAERLGTSASRLSTYASGAVVPAATFLVRMRRLVAAPPLG